MMAEVTACLDRYFSFLINDNLVLAFMVTIIGPLIYPELVQCQGGFMLLTCQIRQGNNNWNCITQPFTQRGTDFYSHNQPHNTISFLSYRLTHNHFSILFSNKCRQHRLMYLFILLVRFATQTDDNVSLAKYLHFCTPRINLVKTNTY